MRQFYIRFMTTRDVVSLHPVYNFSLCGSFTPSLRLLSTAFTTCGEGLDLAILVDLSGSVCDIELDFRDGMTDCNNFRLLKEFLERMVSGLNIGTSDDSDRVSIVTFNGTATVRWRLDR